MGLGPSHRSPLFFSRLFTFISSLFFSLSLSYICLFEQYKMMFYVQSKKNAGRKKKEQNKYTLQVKTLTD